MNSFLTIATGDEKYYRMAVNLLKSYKLHNTDGAMFSILADRRNEYTDQFDEVLILDDPSCSYLDKICMLKNPIFKRNIFIDADCLIYRDIQYLWDLFPEDGVSCFGRKHDLNDGDGWFTSKHLGIYKDIVTSNISLHGGIYYFTDDDITASIYRTCIDIINQYDEFVFKIFTAPADEPVIALSMAINNVFPIDWNICDKNGVYLFYPSADRINGNIIQGKLSYISNKQWHNNISILHFQNINTERAFYRTEIARMTNPTPLWYPKMLGYYCIDAIKKTKNEYIPWIVYEINTKVLRNRRHIIPGNPS